jgi:predicted aspartyl protease
LKAKLKIASLIILTGSIVAPGRARFEKCRVTPDQYCDDGQRQILPVRIFRDFLVVAKGQFGAASESQNFVLDTGTAPSIINESLVRQLGLETVPSTYTAIGKAIPAQAVIIPEIELGPIRAASLPVHVQNLSQLERDLGIPVAGIIGMDVLSKSNFHLDYDKRDIEFGDISHAGIPVHFDPHAGIAVAEVRIEGREARILVDTGTDRVVLFGENFAEPGWLTLRNTSQTGESSVNPKMELRVFSADDIVIGGQHFSDNRAYFVPGSSETLFDGLLGVRALGFRGLSYDQARETIYLQK